ncbi:MAG: hypothetical protein ACLRWF_02640 [Ruthenibacterium sp.]
MRTPRVISTFSLADDKAQMYRDNALRSAASASFSNYGEYLRSLAMRAEIGPFRPGQLGRITQLINKTNQFNLTTRRYTEAEVDACMQDAGCITLAGRLEDKFGDNGLVSALIGRVQGSAVHIELWVMSCRVFKREFELAMFDALVAACRARACTFTCPRPKRPLGALPLAGLCRRGRNAPAGRIPL